MLHFFNTDACYSAIDIFLKNMLSLQTIGEYHCTFLNVRIKCLLNLIIAWPCPVDCYSIRTTLITFYPCANTYFIYHQRPIVIRILSKTQYLQFVPFYYETRSRESREKGIDPPSPLKGLSKWLVISDLLIFTFFYAWLIVANSGVHPSSFNLLRCEWIFFSMLNWS